MPSVSVVILNFNGRHLIAECLDAVLNQTSRDFEVIVVDNGSTDGSVPYLEEQYGSRIILLTSDVNLGFAGGTNRGIGRAGGDLIALLNNDAVAAPTWLEELVSASRHSASSVGMWASKILFYEERDRIDTAGHLIYPDGLNRGRGKGETDRGQYDRIEEVFFPSGCAALYRKEAIMLAGGFDEDFFAYGDDTDIGLKARLAGWTCLFVPSSIVYHRSSATAGTYSPLKAYLVERNRIWILIKYFPLTRILASIPYTLLRYAYQAYGAMSGTGAAGRFVEKASKAELLRVLFRAYRDALAQLPRMIRKRRAMQKLRKATSSDFTSWLRTYKITARELSLRD